MTGKRLTQQVSDAFMAHPPAIVGVAVSGGGDSMALLHLMHGLCTLHGTRLRAVTVNHGLRADAATEADLVSRFCAKLGVPHDTLLWDAWDGTGNLQNEARNARYDLMAAWARQHNVSTIAIGHTADDQAETVLMRLARRAGVNGLAGMSARWMRDGITWVRPLLAATRDDLRCYLQAQHIEWIDDPSNEDTRFQRVRARKALATLADLGIDAEGLSEVAANMALARTALDWQTFLTARDIVEIDAGAVVLDERKMRVLPDEIQRRLLVHAVNWISGETYPPRRAALANLMQALRKGQAGTADGVHARRIGGKIWVFRELNAVADAQTKPDDLWDDRWRVYPTEPIDRTEKITVRALGPEGLEQCPDWRASGRPHAVLLSTPAIWQGDKVIAAPLAGTGQKWHAQVDGGEETFFAALLTH
ncbi:tRNA lysidine(34) synthetase TilS [Sulfitobacter sp. TSTF-M16]|uniref:tRNA(Ile)-lysidine synthase n=1 Tax=Sulfitobacter aestuariivivens TaxID=2766981 RepID=A0A927D3T5_9RHOB|nr:tRNA lysidine(34) synthetase TilS [Sulfitobacter aestuariivivens]MBD3663861.1 tRNA lysidine(34) synthetase TilS [Sulfitobacter aestuariivivens]